MKENVSACLTVDLDAIRQNAQIIAQMANSAKLIPVLKADAYGLGMVPVAKALQTLSAVSCFAVARIQEGIQLQQAGILRSVLVLGAVLPQQMDEAISAGLILSVGRVSDILAIADCSRRLKRSTSVHIKFDTGLCRRGIKTDELPALIDALAACSDVIRIKGAYSHFANPEDAARCTAQYRAFLALTDRMSAAGFSIPMRHICDSAASERYPEFALDAVRIGRRLAWDAPASPLGTVREAATLRSVITDIRARKKGDCLGYGTGVPLQKDSMIASVGIGYGDGLPALIAGRLSVRCCGSNCPILCCFMDQLLVDVTSCDARIGDPVTIFGYDETGVLLSAQKQAQACGALEGCGLTTALLPRVEREYTAWPPLF